MIAKKLIDILAQMPPEAEVYIGDTMNRLADKVDAGADPAGKFIILNPNRLKHESNAEKVFGQMFTLEPKEKK